jgi:hypothetical protein
MTNQPTNTQELADIFNAMGITSASAPVYNGGIDTNNIAVVQEDSLLTDTDLNASVAHLLHTLFDYWIDDVSYGVILLNLEDDVIHIMADFELDNEKYQALGYLAGGPYVSSSALRISHLETRKAVQVLLYNPYPKLFKNIILQVIEKPLKLTLVIN